MVRDGLTGENGSVTDPNLSTLRISPIRAPVKEQVLENLRRAISRQELRAGQRFTERDITALTGASRATVREVIAELASHGVVRTVPPKGTYITELTSDEAELVYEMRAALESLAARLFVRRAKESDYVALKQVGQAVSRSRSIPEMIERKEVLYDTIFACAPPLASMLGWLRLRSALCRSQSLSAAGRLTESKREIEALVSAMLSQNGELAGELARDHVLAAYRAYMVVQDAKSCELVGGGTDE